MKAHRKRECRAGHGF